MVYRRGRLRAVLDRNALATRWQPRPKNSHEPGASDVVGLANQQVKSMHCDHARCVHQINRPTAKAGRCIKRNAAECQPTCTSVRLASPKNLIARMRMVAARCSAGEPQPRDSVKERSVKRVSGRR